jgi:hypothetical protein
MRAAIARVVDADGEGLQLAIESNTATAPTSVTSAGGGAAAPTAVPKGGQVGAPPAAAVRKLADTIDNVDLRNDVYGAHFLTETITQGCHWFPCLLA